MWFAVCVGGMDDQPILGPFPDKPAAAAAGKAWVGMQWAEEREAGGSPFADDDLYRFDVYPAADLSAGDIARAVAAVSH